MLKKVFDKTRVRCHTCNTLLNGYNLKKIGDYYYCEEDYERETETANNDFQKKRGEIFKKIFDTNR